MLTMCSTVGFFCVETSPHDWHDYGELYIAFSFLFMLCRAENKIIERVRKRHLDQLMRVSKQRKMKRGLGQGVSFQEAILSGLLLLCTISQHTYHQVLPLIYECTGMNPSDKPILK